MRIVIPDDNFDLFSGSAPLKKLEGLGEVSHYTDNAPDREALLERLGDAEIVLTTRYQTDFKTTDLLDHMPNLKFISIMGTRPRQIDMVRANARGVMVSVTPGASSQSIAEHTMMFILGLTKNVLRVASEMKEGGWPRQDGLELHGKTLSLLGFGHIGVKVCGMALAFGIRVIA